MAQHDQEWDKYRTTVREFEGVLEHAKAVSASLVGISPPDRYQIYGEQIFVKLLAHCITLRQVSPDPSRRKARELWDLPSQSAVARCVIEAHDAFAYITAEGITHAERDFRLALWELHDKDRRLKMLGAIGSKDPRDANIRADADKLLAAVQGSPVFPTLPASLRKKVATDPPPYHLSQRDRCAECGIDFDFYNAVTMQLSQYVHTLPFSVKQLFGFKGGSTESLRLMNQPLQFALPFLARVATGMRTMSLGETPDPPSRVARSMAVAIEVSARGLKSAG